MTLQAMQVDCPTCGAAVDLSVDASERPFAPFCSKRCRLIDLGEWVEGERVIPGRPMILFDDRDSEEDF